MMRVLIVSHTFPPDSAVGGLRVARLCRYLPECDIHPFVLTVDDGVYESVDPSLVLPSNLKVIRTGSLSTPLDWYRRLIQHRKSQTDDVGIAQGRGPNSSLARQHLPVAKALRLCLQVPFTNPGRLVAIFLEQGRKQELVRVKLFFI